MHSLISHVVSILKKVVPAPLVRALNRPYHFFLTLAVAMLSGFPARSMTVIGVTGTKGKSTVSDMLFAILSHAGYKTALASTIRFAVGNDSIPNQFKMTMQGRGYLQEFLHNAKKKGATHAVVEITSEGTRQFRNAFLFLDGLIVTNISKEHIESHGSFENYIAAKRSIVRTLETSPKKNRALVSNTDNEHTKKFLTAHVPRAIPFSESELENLHASDTETSFTYQDVSFSIPLAGAFNALNALSAIKVAEHLGVSLEIAREALRALPQVRGRVEPIEAGQPFKVIVDYAHTPDSLEALYGAYPNVRKICVLGNTGGGRDTWKRPLMGSIADKHCDTVILTNEDPYDEDPEKIVNDMTPDMKRVPTIVMDRREAIHRALTLAKETDVVLISGKGTDPFIMEANGKKTPWDDATVVREELAQLGFAK